MPKPQHPSRIGKRTVSCINEIYSQYHNPQFLTMDPLCCVRTFVQDPLEAEVAGLLAAMLSYGRVEQIVRTLQTLFAIMENQPLRWIQETSYNEKKQALYHLNHRFNTGADIALAAECIKRARKAFPTLECLALPSVLNPRESMYNSFATWFIQTAYSIDPTIGASFKFLFPAPRGGSACKRMAMYFRWMVRTSDGIDLGIWRNITSEMLIVPIDTHLLKVSKSLGLTHRNQADWKSALEVTDALKKIDRLDPVKYDFSLCRYGMISFRKGL